MFYLLLFPLIVYSKFLRFTIPINQLEEKVTYLTKYGINLGEGTLEMRLRFTQSHISDRSPYFRINTFTDDYWPMTYNEYQCNNKQALAHFIDRDVIPLDGSWSQTIKRSLQLVYRDKIYIFAYSDCENYLTNMPGSIEFEITLKNNNSHYSCEHNSLQYLYGLQAIVSILIGIYCFEKLRNKGEVDDFMKGVCLVLAIDFIAELFLYFHYQIFAFNGSGFFLFDVLGSILSHAANLLLSFLFLALSMGWTITKADLEVQKYGPLAGMMILYQSVILLIMKFYDEKEDKYHNFYGIGGWLLISSKIGLTLSFIIGINKLLKQLKVQIVGVIYQISVVGVLFLISYPCVVFIAEFFVAPYWRHRVITMTNILVSHLCIMFCTYVCTSKSSTYFQLKNKSQTII